MTLRLAIALAAMAPSLAVAQAWFVQSGAAARGEFNDNYFFSSSNRQSAFTASILPFVTAARRTETTDVTAILALGFNQVWVQSPSSTNDYLSGRLGVNGSLRDERSAWTGGISLVRAPSLQSAETSGGTTLVRAYTNTGSVGGTYSYELTERWSVGATASLYANRYDAVQQGSTLSDNSGYNAGATVNYRYSERTRAVAAAIYSHYTSDITRSDAVTTTLGIVHEFSQRLTLSASVGGFWSDISNTQNALECPTTPTLCDTGAVQRVPISSGAQRRDSGPLFGGSLSYAITERTSLGAAASQGISPGSTGTLTRTNNAAASLSHRFSERWTGRLGVGYTRTTFPTGLSGSFANQQYVGEIGTSFRFAERWSLDAGYRYLRAEYDNNPSRPSSNVAFISVAYNWPGNSFTDWVGTWVGADSQVMGAGQIGAGPISLPAPTPPPAPASVPERKAEPDAGAPSAPPDRSTFDSFTIP